MKLSRTERWILSNQYRILETLYPAEAASYARNREALDSGYELHYGWMAERIYDEDDMLSEEDCREVMQILNMYLALKRSYEALQDKSGIEEWQIKFSGFDGNNETTRLAYMRYLNEEGEAYADLDRGDNFNSHMPSLDGYRRQLAEWKALVNRRS
jgi:uncharacterized protein YfbU (UPF0304 family)